jgi:hypothetical protein
VILDGGMRFAFPPYAADLRVSASIMTGLYGKETLSERSRLAALDPERSIDVSDNRHSLTYKQTLNAVIRR